MREIIHVQIGKCGNQVGCKFWEVLCDEHGINNSGNFEGQSDLQLQRLNVYFDEANSGRFVPRAVLIDLEPSTLESCQHSVNGNLFDPNSFVFGESGAANNWAKGFYSEGAVLLDTALDLIRLKAEYADCLQGFQIVHSIGGGTGSGLCSLLLQKLREEYSDRILENFTIFPSPKVSDMVVEPYNAILSIHGLVENSDEVLMLDNEALYYICFKVLKLKQPSYEDINKLISTVMSCITSSLRFPGQLNSDLRKIAVNLIPFPRLHFFMTSYAPLASFGEKDFSRITVSEITKSLFQKTNVMCAVDPTYGKYLCCSNIYRGRISPKQIDDSLSVIQNDIYSSNFVDWIPHNIQYTLCDIPPKNTKICATAILNSTSIRLLFNRVSNQFRSMFSKKAFLHWYTNEGMEEMEFTEAESNLEDLCNEYAQYEINNDDNDDDDDSINTNNQNLQEDKEELTNIIN